MTGPFYLEDGGAATSPSWETDGAPGITNGTLHLFAVDGFVTGIRYYSGDTGVEVTLALWQGATTAPLDAGTLLASVQHTADSIGWHVAAFDTAVAVEPGVPYVASRHHPSKYPFVSAFFGTHGTLTAEDPVYAPANTENTGPALDAAYQTGWDADAINGRFTINAAAGWPGTTGAGAYYGVDAEFYTELPSEGATGELGGELPALTGSLTGEASATGTLSGDLPALTGSLSTAAAATGELGGTLPALTGSLTGTAAATGTLSGSLPALIGTLRESAGGVSVWDGTTETQVTVTLWDGVTETALSTEVIS